MSLGIVFFQSLEVDLEFFDGGLREIGAENVRFGNQLIQQLLAFFFLQIQRDALFIPIRSLKKNVFAVGQRHGGTKNGGCAAGRISLLPILDLDNFERPDRPAYSTP